MSLRASLCVMAGLAAAAPLQASAEDVRFTPRGGDPAVERIVDRALDAALAGWTRDGPPRVETARVDLDGDRGAELAVRVDHPNACSYGACMTIIYRYVGGAWKSVFAGRTEGLRIGDGERGREMPPLASGDRGWRWNPRAESYVRVFEEGETGRKGLFDRQVGMNDAEAMPRESKEWPPPRPERGPAGADGGDGGQGRSRETPSETSDGGRRSLWN